MDTQEATLFESLRNEITNLQTEKEFLSNQFDQTKCLLEQTETQHKNEIAFLNSQLEWYRRQMFGKKSEKVLQDYTTQEQQLYFPGFEPVSAPSKEDQETIPAHTRRKRKSTGKDAISIPENLPVEEIFLDIPEDQKVCPKTGQPLVKIREEVTSKLAHIPESYYLKKITRPIYGLPNGEGIISADTMDSFLPRCRADESLLAEIITKKFTDHIPLNRMSEIFQRVDLGISTQLLSQWVLKCAKGLKPLHDLMRKKILEEDLLFVDESPVSVQVKGKGKVHQAYMWVLVGGGTKYPPYRYFEFSMNRKHENIDMLIENYRGILHSDKYGAYETLANRGQIVWCPCWAHIRRKFFESDSGDTEFCDWVVGRIQKLFKLEKEARELGEEEMQQIRQEKEIPIIDELITEIRGKLEHGYALPKSKYREALRYFCSLIPYLKNYTTNPHARLDNNISERTIRALAVGRKNWLFAGSEKGGAAAAVLLSIMQSCRAVGVNPREYLEDVMKRINDHPFNRLEELLPDQWTKTQPSTN